MFYGMQSEEIEKMETERKTGVKVLNASTPEQEEQNIMRVLGISG